MQQSEELFLREYDPAQFERPSVTVDILVMTVYRQKLHLLLVKRSEHPFLGKWALPGGFLRMDESAEEAAARILLAKAGVSGAHLEQLYTFSSVDRDPRTRVLSIAFLATVPYGKLKYAAGDSVETASLFAVDGVTGDGIDTGAENAFSADGSALVLTEQDRDASADGNAAADGNTAACGNAAAGGNITADSAAAAGGSAITGADLAFDHETIIRTAVLRMRGKIGYTDLAFGFLEDPSAFTLTELRRIYEAVLGRALDIGNFRRTIKREYESTGKITERGLEKGAVGRPAMLYRAGNAPARE